MSAATAPRGVATGVGSLPGGDVDAAVALVFDTLPELPHVPELPGRGPGADLVGRTAGALVGLHVDLQPSGWRLVPRAGTDERRARDLLETDLDALVPVAAGYDGWLKAQLAGPWTLAAAIEVPRGEKAVGDVGAVRDIVASLAETVAEHVADVVRRVPGADVVLQLDEPSLPAVLAGQVPTASGWRTLRAVDRQVVRDGLRAVADAAGVPVVVHCCHRDVPIALLRETGVAAVSFDLSAARPDLDDVGAAVEAGLALWLGVLPALGPGAAPSTREVLEPVRALWRRLGFPPERLPDTVTLTPACGLAGASEGWVRTALPLLHRAARALAEAPEGVRA